MIKKIVHIVFLLLVAAVLGAGVVYYLDYRKHAPQREDYERIASEDFTSVFFSTFPTDYFSEEDFEYYRAIYPIKASYCIPDPETLDEYFLKVSETWNDVTSAYLGIRPDIIGADDIIRLTESNGSMRFEIIVSYPSMEYWRSLDEEEYPAVMQSYKDFVNTLMTLREENEWMQSNLFLYFFNSAQWLVNNPQHYESDFGVNENISRMLSTYLDGDHGYQLTGDNYEALLEDFEEMVETCRTEPKEYPDLSKWDIVFFGDSIMAVDNTSSIPCALTGLTGAHTYNCARGGSSAATIPGGNVYGISEVVDMFLAEDLSALEEDSLMYKGMKDYFKSSKKNRTKCFVLNFGMNDYYGGLRVRSEDSHDVLTYSGALRTAVEKLQEAYPDALILLMTPNFTSYFGNGLEPQSDVGGLLPDYVTAAVALSEEMDTLLFDSYTRLGIDSTNHSQYLVDGTHPNDATRYVIAQHLADLLQKQIPEGK